MKTLITVLVFPLVVLAAVAVAVYQLIASIPPWLLVVVIAYLIYRLRRRASRRRTEPVNNQPARVQAAWSAPQVQPPAPTVVYVVAPNPRPQRNTYDAPEPWILH